MLISWSLFELQRDSLNLNSVLCVFTRNVIEHGQVIHSKTVCIKTIHHVWWHCLWFCNIKEKNASNLINQFKICSRSTFIYSKRWEKKRHSEKIQLNENKTQHTHTIAQKTENKKNGVHLTYLVIAHSANSNFIIWFHSFNSLWVNSLRYLLIICACALKNVTSR